MFRSSASAATRRGASAAALGIACVLLFSGSRPADELSLDPVVVDADPAIFAPKALAMTAFFPNPRPRVQAVGSAHQPADTRATDHQATLREPTELDATAPGLRVLSPGRRTHFGTYELVELIQQVGATYDELYPGQVVRVGDLSRPRGGTIRDANGERVHSSHRNGLDADLMYLHTDCREPGNFDDPMCPVDVPRSLELMRMFVAGGPDDSETMVDLFYVGSAFQERTCRYLREHEEEAEHYRDVLDRLQLMGGHESHFHVRILCPEQSLRCPAPRKHRPDLCPRVTRQLDAES